MNSKLKHLLLIAGIILFESFCVNAADKTYFNTLPQYIQYEGSRNAFSIVSNGKATSIYVDAADWKGVIRAANDLGDDVRKV